MNAESERVKNELKEELKARLRTLALQRFRPPFDPLEEFIRRMAFHESDRGCVIIGAAYLHDALKPFLVSRLGADARNDKKALADFFAKPTAPLSSFWARIECAYLFGFIEGAVRDALHKMRELRNRFAHKHGPEQLTLDDVEVIVKKLPLRLELAVRARAEGYEELYSELLQRVNRIEQMQSELATQQREEDTIGEQSAVEVKKFSPVRNRLTVVIGTLDSELEAKH